MQFIPFFLFTILCTYSLVIAAPIKNETQSLEAKQQKATEIANRLLKQIANEQQSANHQKEKILEQPEVKGTDEPLESPKLGNDFIDNDDMESDETVFDKPLRLLNRYYETYEDDEEIPDDLEEALLSESDIDNELADVYRQRVLDYLENQDESDYDFLSMIHTPVMDDSIMTAEDHRRRRSVV